MRLLGNPMYLSVVMSTYNDERYIREAIDSILNQTYPFFEFIIVNDGSTDNTLRIIRSYNDSRIRIIDKENTGLPDSLNKGIAIAKYDWIARMDADDIALPTRFETQVKYLKKGITVIGGQGLFIDENGDTVGRTSFPTESKMIKCWARLKVSKIIHPAAIISKNVIMELGGYDKFLHGAEDFDLWLRISNKGLYLANTKDVVLKYRINPNGISRGLMRGRQQIASAVSYIKYKKRILGVLDEQLYHKIVSSILESKQYQILVNCNCKDQNIVCRLYRQIKLCRVLRQISKNI